LLRALPLAAKPFFYTQILLRNQLNFVLNLFFGGSGRQVFILPLSLWKLWPVRAQPSKAGR
jgi:hypothetical protein